jgi:hypothetical protein
MRGGEPATSADQDTPVSLSDGSEDYRAAINAGRNKRDEEFRSLSWSPLAVAAIVRLDRPRLLIGSGPNADLQLSSELIGENHAEIVREQDPEGNHRWLLRALDGSVHTTSDQPEKIDESTLARGSRLRIGRYVIYYDVLGTLGPVVRALDYDSPSFTRFAGLSYFPPDPAFRVESLVTPYPEIQEVTIGDTHGWQRKAWRYGEAAFTLNGYKLRMVLMLFRPDPGPEDTFFIAFTDATSGTETYPAARYINVPYVPSGPMQLDFNLAQNPSCAYNKGFACPLPPWENRLPLEIRAGEKIYPHAAETY